MCLIAFKESSDGVFTNKNFRNMIRRNRHGLGIMWREDGRVKTEKTIGSEKDKFKLWSKHRDKDSYAMHARLTTHGLTNLANCHPYELLNIDNGDPIDLYMMHNGVISNAPETDKDMSDTWHFVEYILKPIAKANLEILWDNEQFQLWLQTKITGSKLLFMRSDDVEHPVLILNHSAGTEKDGFWLSNTHSTDIVFAKHTPKATNTSYGGGRERTWYNSYSCYGYGYEGNDYDEDYFNSKPVNKTQTTTTSIPSLKPPTWAKQPAEQDLLDTADVLKKFSAQQVKEWATSEPECAADFILYMYKENSMDYASIINKIKDNKSVDEIVDIIRHTASVTDTTPIKKAN